MCTWPRAQLITDFYGYNTDDIHPPDRSAFWVGDLTISGVVQIE